MKHTAITCFLLALSCAKAPEPALRPVDVDAFWSDVAPVWSPDGSRIAFGSNRTGHLEVFTVRPDGSDLLRVTDLRSVTYASSWSPDGIELLLESQVSGDRELYAMRYDGTGLRRLTSIDGRDSHPYWSPDGDRIYFYSERDGDAEIYSMDAQGEDVRRLTSTSGRDVTPVPSPDGTRIVFGSERTGDRELFLMSVNGSSVTQLTDSPGFDGWPQWSPDGSSIAFVSNRTGDSDLYVVGADGTGLRRLTDTPRLDYQLSWSPDGEHLAFRSDRDGRAGIYIMNRSGTNVTKITNRTLSDFATIAWRDGANEALDLLDRVPDGVYFLETEVLGLGVAALETSEETAARLFQAAVAAYPRSADAFEGLGNAYRRLGRAAPPTRQSLVASLSEDPDGALELIRENRASFPGWVLLADADWVSVSSGLREHGDVEAATRILEAATENDPSAALLVALGDAYRAAGNKAAAVSAFERAVAANGGDDALDRLRVAQAD